MGGRLEIWHEIVEECARQDAQWGAPGLDGHDIGDWRLFVDRQLSIASMRECLVVEFGSELGATRTEAMLSEVRARLLKTAGLLLAAVESFDRRYPRVEPAAAS